MTKIKVIKRENRQLPEKIKLSRAELKKPSEIRKIWLSEIERKRDRDAQIRFNIFGR